MIFPDASANIIINANLGSAIPNTASGRRNWETSVWYWLTQIRAFQTGRIVIESIQSLRPRMLYVIPGIRAETILLVPSMQEVSDSTRAGQLVYSCDDGHSTGAFGTGHGLNRCGITLPTPFATNSNAHHDIRAIIIHEMTHALLKITGQESCASYGTYQNESQFYAILTENIFASEVGLQLCSGDDPASDSSFAELCEIVLARIRPNPNQPGRMERLAGFRGLADSLRQSGLPKPSKDDLGQFSIFFAVQHARVIRALNSQVPFLYNRLRNATSAPFNPIRDMAAATSSVIQ